MFLQSNILITPFYFKIHPHNRHVLSIFALIVPFLIEIPILHSEFQGQVIPMMIRCANIRLQLNQINWNHYIYLASVVYFKNKI